MVQFIPPPNPNTLLPPLLACLPTAFASPRPPPALLPLLSPILRQRVQLLSGTTSDSWLSLLSWDGHKAEKLGSAIESDAFELHPVSGAVEFTDVESVLYRRVDEETLQAKVSVPELDLVVIYLWCTGDEVGGGDGWRVTEVGVSDDWQHTHGQWSSSIAQAEDKAAEDATRVDFIPSNGTINGTIANGTADDEKEAEEDDDDDYWAQYDQTPGVGRTPMDKSPAPDSRPAAAPGRGRSASEAEYFQQYDDVQPALDDHDPDEDAEAPNESTLRGGEIERVLRRQQEGTEEEGPVLSHPRPSSVSSTRSDTVARLEDTAETSTRVEFGIKQHISTSFKSLFRLAASAGIEKQEFARIIRSELDTIDLLEDHV